MGIFRETRRGVLHTLSGAQRIVFAHSFGERSILETFSNPAGAEEEARLGGHARGAPGPHAEDAPLGAARAPELRRAHPVQADLGVQRGRARPARLVRAPVPDDAARGPFREVRV